jgi:predicted amidohydrolase YtcJ
MKPMGTLLLLPLLVGCAASTPPTADTIYSGGTLLTMNDAAPAAEAIAIREGKILCVGTQEEVLRFKGKQTRVVDLGGKTMLPGFVDAHSHFSGVGMQAISANLLPSPDGPVNSIPDLQAALREHLRTSKVVQSHRVVIGFNYDDSQLAERRHPTRHDLDDVSADLPVFAMHQSGHLGVYNTAALRLLGVSGDSPDPPGGVIEREADGRTPSGVMQENAHFALMYRLVPNFSDQEYVALLQAGQEAYVRNGFTTVQDGKTDEKTLKALPKLAAGGAFKVDVVAYADLVAIGDSEILHSPLMSRQYADGFRLGGVKLTLDGSPQGKTAWFTKPYLRAPAGEKPTYSGYPALSDDKLADYYRLARKNGWQLLVHANGDAAIDQLLRVASSERDKFPEADQRTVLIHGQFLRADQVDPLSDLSIFPALYPMHTFYWGDWHRDSVAGPERAANISPTGWLRDRGVRFTIHSDAPVTFPNSARLLDSAVNRTTRSGKVLGADHRLEPALALKALTLWGAYQHFEEESKGSLEVGKLADLVILDKNPLSVPRGELKELKVLETIKEGRTVFRAGE